MSWGMFVFVHYYWIVLTAVIQMLKAEVSFSRH